MTLASSHMPNNRPEPGVEFARVHGSLLAGPERRLLDLLIERMPIFVKPDHLTAIGVLGSVLALAGFAASNIHPAYLWLAILGIVVHWFGDSMDGSLARARKIERPGLGFFIDQMVDVGTNVIIAVGIGLSPHIRMDVALLVLAGYHMLSLFTFVRKGLVKEFRVDIGRIGPTEIRIGIVGICLGLLFLDTPRMEIFGETFTWADVALVATFAGMAALFMHVVIQQGIALNNPDYRKAWLLSAARLRRDRRAKQRAKQLKKKVPNVAVRPSSFFPTERPQPPSPPTGDPQT
jgi:archaetidylinositol phosphate synthase